MSLVFFCGKPEPEIFISWKLKKESQQQFSLNTLNENPTLTLSDRRQLTVPVSNELQNFLLEIYIRAKYEKLSEKTDKIYVIPYKAPIPTHASRLDPRFVYD
jgi:hypothetical protein